MLRSMFTKTESFVGASFAAALYVTVCLLTTYATCCHRHQHQFAPGVTSPVSRPHVCPSTYGPDGTLVMSARKQQQHDSGLGTTTSATSCRSGPVSANSWIALSSEHARCTSRVRTLESCP